MRCSNEGCDSRTDPEGSEPFFSIDVTVDKNRDLAGSLDRYFVDAGCFTCWYCGSDAEEESEE